MTKKKLKYQRKKRSHGKSPNFLGQHLMHNKKLINDIVDLTKVNIDETVLELGAGKGALTTILNQRAGKVLAVEYDKKFVNILEIKTENCPNTTIIHQDILKIYLPKEKFIVVSNIPYSITTPIMKKLLNNPLSNFQRGVIVMEKGAAKRFTSRLVKNPYVIAWRMWFDIRYVKGISRKNFSPPPRVDSALITINRKVRPIVPIADYLIFWGMADYVLKNPQLSIDLALRGVFTPPQIKHLKRNLGIKNDFPVSSLSEQQWGIIFETMVKHVPRFRWPKMKKGKLDFF
ncbi:23S ribosomal RNA methyltransferase Erm [Gracilibacillus sp. D59]|uniref:23S ribosomal RNA methyltransferase Erm n=1 Tax=Gracilibacillus sp. D59 TaxID=3457434 RepID=UPI003FCD446C